MKLQIKLLDEYFKRPLFYDAAIILIIIWGFYLNRNFYVKSFNYKDFDNILSNIISTIVSFTGFVITALTVIVTVKASLKIRDINEAKNGLELLLTSKNYRKIVSVFKFAIVELVFGLIVMYFLWTPFFIIPYYGYLIGSSVGIFLILITMFRTVYVFFNIIFLEFVNDEE